jgi:hypothetical protein
VCWHELAESRIGPPVTFNRSSKALHETDPLKSLSRRRERTSTEVGYIRASVMVQFQFPADDFFSIDTSVALIMAKTASPFLRFIRLTEPVVMIEVTSPAAVLTTISETTLSDTICSIVPGK